MADSQTKTPSGGRRQRLVRGGLLMTVVSIANRLSSFVAQLFVGRILFEEEFGLFAVALGITGVGLSVRNVLQPVLVHQLENDNSAYERTYRMMMLSALALALTGAAASNWIGDALSEPDLPLLLAFMFAIIPLQLVPIFGITRLTHQLSFGPVSTTVTIAGFVRQGSTVAFAFAGFGVFSFAYAAALAAVVELAVLSRYTDLFPRPGLFSRQTLTDLAGSVERFRSTVDRRWVWLSALAVAAWKDGDYAAASLFAETATIGLYYFAYSIAWAISSPLHFAVNAVVVPGFVALKTTEEKRLRFVETIRLLSVLGVLMFNGFAVIVVPLTHFLWDGKWDASIIALLGFTLLAPLRFIHPVILAIQRGSGYWNLYFVDNIVAGVATLLAAGVGAYIGGLGVLVAIVMASKSFVTLFSLRRLTSRYGGDFLETVKAAIGPWILGIPALAVSHLVYPLDGTDITPSLVRLVVFGVLTVGLVVVPYRAALMEVITAARPGPKKAQPAT